ncbi:MAG: methylenetetrahydromethanopterin dehydrogenase [Sinobacteraceae bacterium]|nr:methylenetetrahydromethanopterin dehydrogenase [Nevskia sp.]MDI3258752.1 methylenetetrahydromethanopterin dehydrogenase [Nevskiaceae bacterium]
MEQPPYLLHFATPGARVSPFDVNMAYDAGWDAVIPYAGVGLDDIAAFTQDAIFSRGPRGVRRTALFIGGRDALLAADMLQAARSAMVPPFEVSVFADPSGAYTTAGAMIAKVEQALERVFQRGLSACRVLVLGGTGPVGLLVSTLAAQAGAQVFLGSHSGEAAARAASDALARRFGVRCTPLHSGDAQQRARALAQSEVVLAVAKAGVQVLSRRELETSGAHLLVAADVNAVPPEGIESVAVKDDARPLGLPGSAAVGIGALAIGNVKYKTEQALLRQLRETEQPRYFGFVECLEEARRQRG